MSLYNEYSDSGKENEIISSEMVSNISKVLKEMILYFPESSDLLNDYINKLQNGNCTDSIKTEIKDLLFYDVISDKRTYLTRDEYVNKIVYLNYSIKDKEDIENRLFINKSSNKYKIYDIFLSTEYFDKKSKEIFDKIFDDLFNNSNLNLLERIDLERKIIDTQISKYKDIVLKTDFDPYYGSTDFMLGRISFINDCVNKIIESDLVSQDIKFLFNEVPKILNSYKNDFINKTSQLNNPYKYYEEVEKYYKEIISLENNLSVYMQPIWDEYLTDPKDYVEGEPFRFLAHVLTGGYVESSLLNKTCCTLVTDKCMPLPFGEYGYIMKFDVNNLGFMSYDDAGSWLITKEEFVEKNFPSTCQLSEKQGDNFVWYENEKISKLVLPWNIEKEMINNNTNRCGHPLNKCYCYSEVFLTKNDTCPLKTLAMFAKDDSALDEINLLDNNLKKIKIDLNVYRKKAGLEPIDSSKSK